MLGPQYVIGLQYVIGPQYVIGRQYTVGLQDMVSAHIVLVLVYGTVPLLAAVVKLPRQVYRGIASVFPVFVLAVFWVQPVRAG